MATLNPLRIWQRAALALDPTARDRAWGFPTGFFEYPNGWEGCEALSLARARARHAVGVQARVNLRTLLDTWPAGWVDDVLTSNFGFTDIFPGAAPANAAGFTHREVLFYTDPDRTPYTYENMNNPFNPLGKRRELLHEGGDKGARTHTLIGAGLGASGREGSPPQPSLRVQRAARPCPAEFKWPTEFLKRKRSEEVEKQVLEAYKGTSAYKHWKRFANRRRSSNGTRHL